MAGQPGGVIDVDQHLYEPRTLWLDHIDPDHRDDALAIVDDDLGYPLLTWRDQVLDLADVQVPGDTALLGRRRNRRLQGLSPEYSYDEALPPGYWDPAARIAVLDDMGVDAAVCFPNYGLLWERRLSADLPSLLANMAAWNRWCAEVVTDSRGRIHPVGHLSLRDVVWLDGQLDELSAAGVRLAMIAPALVDGRPLSHPDHDRLWASFVEHGVTPVFHVADQPRVFDDAWYTDGDDSFVPVLQSVFLWTAAALAVTDLLVNGTLQRLPSLRLGIVELSAVWVPLYLLMLDGGWDFTSRLNGRALTDLALRPSEYFERQVRVAAFAYEQPGRLIDRTGDLFMCCSDYPHSEGSATPVADYTQAGCDPARFPGLFHDNAAWLLGASGHASTVVAM